MWEINEQYGRMEFFEYANKQLIIRESFNNSNTRLRRIASEIVEHRTILCALIM